MKLVTEVNNLHNQGIDIIYAYSTGFDEKYTNHVLDVFLNFKANKPILSYVPKVTPYSFKIIPFTLKNNQLLFIAARGCSANPKQGLQDAKIENISSLIYLGNNWNYCLYTTQQSLPKFNTLIHKLKFSPSPMR